MLKQSMLSIGRFLLRIVKVAASRLYDQKKQTMLYATAIFMLSASGVLLLQPDWQIETRLGCLPLAHICATAVGTDNSIYINEDNRQLIALRPDGSLNYIINITPRGSSSNRIAQFVVDDRNNLYITVTTFANDGPAVNSREINMYDQEGRFIKQLLYIDYSQEVCHANRASPMYIHQDELDFACWGEKDLRFYSIDLHTGQTTMLSKQEFDIPFLYQSIFIAANHGYYYTKITGEVGYGIVGQQERPLATYNYDMNTGGPFISALFPLDGTYYCYDAHDDSAWRLEETKGFSRIFPAGSTLASMSLTSLNASHGRLCGSTENLAWYCDYDGTVHTFSQATVPIARLIQEILLRLCYILCILAMAGSILYAIGGIIYAYIGPHASIMRKMLMLLPIIFAAIIYMIFMVFHFYQEDYTQRSYRHISHDIRIVAGSIDGDMLSDAKSSTFFNSQAYKSLSHRINEAFPAFTDPDSETAVTLMIPSSTGTYTVIDTTDNSILFNKHDQGYRNLLPQIQNKLDSTGVAAFHENGLHRFYAPIYDHSHKLRGYLCATMTVAHQYTSFSHTVFKLLPALITCLLLLASILIIMAVLLGRNAARAATAITKIASGNLNVRITTTSNDEIGHISTCINHMAENLQELFRNNHRLNEDMIAAQKEVIASFAEITEAKSGQTGHHVKRVAEYTFLMARAIGHPDDEAERLSIASMMHDVGKLLIPSEILDKPRRLSASEFAVVKKHTLYGGQLLANAPGTIMNYARIIALEHHERFDGTGYPYGLAGTNISRAARIVAIADVFDALVSRRSYKESWSCDAAFDFIRQGRGIQFDPKLTDLFLEHRAEIIDICQRLPDT